MSRNSLSDNIETYYPCDSSHLKHLKIDLLCHGVKVTKRAYESLTKDSKPITLREYATTSGIGIKLPNEIYVNVPMFESFCKGTKNLLEYDGADYYISSPLGTFKAEPIPIPSYFNKLNKNGMPYTFFAVTHTDRVRVSPISGCSMACYFCDMPYTLQYIKKDINDSIEATQVAIDDEILPAKHVLISGGTPLPKDFGYMDEAYKKIAEATDVPVDVMMVPRPNLDYIEKLYSWGINMIYFNIELYNKQIAKKYTFGKYRVSLNHYLAAIEKAVDVFGKGQVQSLIIVGLESLEDTLKGVHMLAERGCIPVLSPFRPAPAAPLANHPPPTVDQLIKVYEAANKITTSYDLRLGPRCIPCHHNTLTFPDNSGFYFPRW